MSEFTELCEACDDARYWRNKYEAFTAEWVNRFGFLARENPEYSIESIDEVACLLDVKKST